MKTILLVDDDPLQASMLLSHLGHHFGKVRRAADAAEALCLIEQPGFAAQLRLVISGHHMPGLGGPELVSELHARLPGISVLVLESSGEGSENYNIPHTEFLAKPLTPEKILDAVSRLLAHRKVSAA